MLNGGTFYNHQTNKLFSFSGNSNTDIAANTTEWPPRSSGSTAPSDETSRPSAGVQTQPSDNYTTLSAGDDPLVPSEGDPLLALRPPPVVVTPQPTDPCPEDALLVGQPADARPEYHLLPHSVPDAGLYWPADHQDQVLPVEALFEAVSEASQPSRRSRDCSSSDGLPPEVEVRRPARRYRRMVSYSRTGLTPLCGAAPERSSSIPVHLDQIRSDGGQVGSELVQWWSLVRAWLG